MTDERDRHSATCIARYAELIDAGDFDGVADLLEGAASRSGRRRCRSSPGTTRSAGCSPRPPGSTRTARRGTKHVTTNLILEIDEDEGRGDRPLLLDRPPGGRRPAAPADPGRAVPRPVRPSRRGPGRFAERRYLVDLVGDVSHHMLGNQPT